jgi:alpha-tubulin suppressor-like RCC1 family protein
MHSPTSTSHRSRARVIHARMLALAVALVIGLLSLHPSAASAATPQVRAGIDTTAWLKSDGTVWMMGSNLNCELGIGGPSADYTYRARPVQVLVAAGTPLTNITKIDDGPQGLVAIDATGAAWYTGGSCSTYAQKVRADSSGTQLTGIADAAKGFNCTMYLTTGGQVLQQGSGCVAGTTIFVSYPTPVTDQFGTPYSGVIDVNCSKSPWPSCALVTSTGAVWAWGSNNNSKLGVGVSTSKITWPTRAVQNGGGFLTNAVEVAASMWGTWARKSDGTVWSVGDYDSNSVDTTACSCFAQVETAPGVFLTSVVEIDGGAQSHFLARRSNGTVWGAGWSIGQFGDGTMTTRTTVSQVGAGTTWVGIAAGRATSFLLRNDGTLWAGGWNQAGELGVCDMVPRLNLVQVTTCASPYNPWKPRAFVFKNPDGSVARSNGTDNWVRSGVSDSVTVEFETGDEDATDTLTPRYQFVPQSNPGFNATDACTVGTALPTVATTSLVPVTVSHLQTGLVNGTIYKARACMVDSGGRVSGWGYTDEWWVGATLSDNSVRVDVVAPANPTSIIDGSGADIDSQTSLTSMTATLVATDALSGVWGATACVTTSPTGADCSGAAESPWASHQGTTFTVTGLTLTSGTTYYVCAKSEDYAGNVSAGFLCTDGVVVDGVAPTNPTARNDGTAADVDLLASSTTLDGNWNAGSDDSSGVKDYDFCFSTSSSGADCATTAVKAWTNTTGLTGTATGLALLHGTTYYLCLRTRDNAGNISTTACSDGAILDVSAPTVALVSPANLATLVPATPTFTATYADGDGDAGTIAFDVCSDATCTGIVRSGTSASVASGANGSWTVGTALASSTQYWWRARSVDGPGRTSAWSTLRSFTTAAGPLVPSSEQYGTASNDWFRDDKDGGTSCPGAPTTTTGEELAISDDVDAPVSTGCVAGAGNPESDYIRTATNPGTATDSYELTDSPGTFRSASALTLRTRAWKTGGKSATITMTLYAYDGSTIGKVGPSSLTTSEAEYSATFSGLTLYRTDLDGMYVQVVGTTSGGGSSTTIFDTAINVDLTTVTSTLASNPTTPAQVAPANAALVTPSPALTATFSDPDVGNTGKLRYELCADAPCPGPRPDSFGSSAAGLAIGANGSWTAPAPLIGTTYYWRVRGQDNSGNEGSWSAWRSFTIDGPPATPTGINDGTGADIDWSKLTTQLSANWSPVADGDLNRYEYCFSTATGCGGTIITNWTSTSTTTSVTKTGLALTNGSTYFTCVRAVDNQTNVSGVACSDAVTIDTSLPAAPSPVADGTGVDVQWDTTAAQLSANWPAASDTGSGVQDYDYCITTSSTGIDCAAGAVVTDTVVVGVTFTRTGLALTNGTLYYACVRTRDGAGNVSARTCSNGQRVDTTVPTAPTTRNDGTAADIDWATSTTQLDGNWSGASAGASGIAGYDDCFSTSSTGADCAAGATATWTAIVPSSVSRSGLTLSSGTRYYLCVRTRDNAGRTSTPACSDGAVVDATAPPTVTTLSGPIATTTSPAMTWTTVTDSGSGVAFYRVWRGTSAGGPWTLVSTDGTVTSGAYTDATATVGSTWWYKVAAVDQATNVANDSNVIAIRYHRVPAVPVLVSPGSGATGLATSPTLTATHSDPDGDSGTLSFQVCADSACTSVVTTGSSAVGIASGSNGSWSVASTLVAGSTYWWRAMATDSSAATSAWSATRSFTVQPVTVTAVNAASKPQGIKGAVVTVTGTSFTSGATVAFSGTGISVTNVTYVSSTSLTVTLDVTGAASTGLRNVTVTNPDGSNGTGTSVFSITSASISIVLSSLGYADTTRDTTVPYGTDFGVATPGLARSIGPAGSGQALAGAAVAIDITSDTTTEVLTHATAWTGPAALTLGTSLLYKTSAGATWTGFTTTDVVVEQNLPPAAPQRGYDLQLVVPANQAAGSYSSTTTWTVIAQP